MPFDLSAEDLAQAVPAAIDVAFLDRGGQKLVFSCTIAGSPYVLKVLQPTPRRVGGDSTADLGANSVSLDDISARARREVATMKECDSPYLVKIGPIEMTSFQIGDSSFLCFSEERIDGTPLNQILRESGVLAPSDVLELGKNIAHAIDALWAKRKIHRDIKPSNIMRRRTGSFVLLDLGLVFDLNDESYSVGPVGTCVYFSPEQMDFANRRQVLDFRSDLFSLGITMYEMATGIHPFLGNATSSWEVINHIKTLHPVHPSEHNSAIPSGLGDVILRLLGKRPSLRYRSVDRLLRELDRVVLS